VAARERSVADVHRTAAALKARPYASLGRAEQSWLCDYAAACAEVEAAERAIKARGIGRERPRLAVKAEGERVTMKDIVSAARVANEMNCVLVPDNPEPPSEAAIKRESSGASSRFSAIVRAASRTEAVPD